jgi:erythromycin esterase-like protein/adenine/guanine phosphoribosyltransferase-like PRPP-binding protein
MMFRDRRHAGRLLAAALASHSSRDDVLVLALPRGGVPVAFEVARVLRAPLDVFLVRKLGAPDQEELAMGAIASGGVRVINDEIVRMLRIDAAQIDAVARREQRELDRRERAYRGDRPEPDMAGKVVIVVDDGLATGATMRAAVQALRARAPAQVIVAVPVGAADTCAMLRREADAVVCLHRPDPFVGVGAWYDDFGQTTDEEVRELLASAAPARPSAAHPARVQQGDPALAALRKAALPLGSAPSTYDALLQRIGDAPLVLLGEASHGTDEFYRIRADITRRLILERGFNAIAIEGDWPDAYRVNRYVRGDNEDRDATAALSGFLRFPTWMWRNTVVRDFIAWLRTHNDARTSAAERVGFYGLDLYSLHGSIEAVLDYLERTDPAAAARARHRYACFDHFGEDTQAYGYAASFDLSNSCEDEVVDQLLELRRRAAVLDGHRDDEMFFAEQNARLVRNAEAYYRSMFRGRVSSWNLRDGHMMETLQALIERGTMAGRRAKIVVWAHNSHLGDARATDMGERGELNLGQLVRERHPEEAVLIGFSTYQGTVTAAHDWDEPAHRQRVRPGLPDSYEALFHDTGVPRFQIDLDDATLRDALSGPRLQRAIGVIYRPQTERLSHYFQTRVTEQFDWMLHIDQTRALHPLERGEAWHHDELPETWPSGL